MTREFRIGNRLIDDSSPGYCIAEIGGTNHQGSLERAKLMARAAADAGFHAIKSQMRANEQIFTKAYLAKSYDNSHSFGATYGEHRAALEFRADQHRELKAYAESRGLDYICTAFDPWSADTLAEIGVAAIKIASGDCTNTPLLAHAAGLGLPMIVSTGAATMDDVDRAAGIMVCQPREDHPIGGNRMALLACTAAYPCPAELLNLRTIETYRERYPRFVIGLSTHFSGPQPPSWAYILGARIFEVHITLNRAAKGTDNAFSLEMPGMRACIRDLERVRLAMGDGVKRVLPEEAGAIQKMGKSIVAARPIRAGDVIGSEDLALKSPGGGLPPYRLAEVVGTRATRTYFEDEAIEGPVVV